jgi:preprotein translocase subunit SecF
MNIIGRRKIWFTISGVAVLLSVLSLIFFGLRLGIDFKGGTLLELEFSKKPDIKEIREVLVPFNLGSLVILPSGDKKLIIKSSYIDQQTHEKIQNSLKEKFGAGDDFEKSNEAENQENKPQEEVENKNEEEIKGEADKEASEGKQKEEGVTEIRYETVGPTIGKDLTKKSIYSLIIASFCVILYIAWAFRKVSKPVKSWKFGVCAILALIHDVLITLGLFSILGKFLNIEVGSFSVVALLTIIGYSVNDSVVIFDRIRENLRNNPDVPFGENVNNSVIGSITRSVNTTLTTLFAAFALFLFVGEAIKYFALALIIGFISGTYSSIFIASPFLVVWRNLERKFKIS